MRTSRYSRHMAPGLAALMLIGCAAYAGSGSGSAAGEGAATAENRRANDDAYAKWTSLRGYLAPADRPDGLLIVPPPPAPGSVAQKRDDEASAAGLAQVGAPRFGQAALDADLASARATSAFSCAAGFRLGPDTTPRLDSLLRRTLRDFGMGTKSAKDRYSRPRPFMVNERPTCSPGDEALLRKDGSYPSGHSAGGFGWGLLLAELVPERSAQLVARGIAFGDSRRVCNVHWQSDIEAGRTVAAAVFARLHADPAFVADMAAARAEIAALPASAREVDCTREAEALGS